VSSRQPFLFKPVVRANNSRAFAIVGMILWCVMESIGELATLVCLNGTDVVLVDILTL